MRVWILILVAVVIGCTTRDQRSAARHTVSALSLDSLRCGEANAQGQCDLYDVSLYELITRPEAFHGKRVRVIGFAHFEFEGDALYAHREDWERGLLKNGVWLVPPKSGADSLNNHYILVEGRFSATSRGHFGLWSGSLDSVTRYDVWAEGEGPASRRHLTSKDFKRLPNER